ncbi:DUF4123 domain-containing protein [Hahella sp. KA22]|uniref:DUF4123 domain-containing protein n=1 Tax=Hahella sp. KA22 TaxID=1628392 RepID=UPI000FDE28F3|nr:DUF4123 domain-containing protein [Hahella sp. KA22]AZZ90745.1 DUF4123 domain-containing protein [Hahella sp. KA22]QAY54116.1 DUF4123 domain-containing protein [Hahella sp. KA22]
MKEIPCFQQLQHSCPGYRHYYALADCAIDDSIYQAILRSDNDSMCLFRDVGSTLRAASPHLIELGANTFTQWYFHKGWGRNWGIFIASYKPIQALAHHFRKLNRVLGPNNEKWLFRYYSPNILREFLPICDQEQLERIMGDIGSFWMEDKDDAYSLCYQRNFKNLRQTRQSLDSASFEQTDITLSSAHSASNNDTYLKITQYQHERLAEIPRRKFIYKLATDFKDCYPQRLQCYNLNTLQKRVETALNQMNILGLKARHEAYYYIYACITFGWDFLSNPEYAWIRKRFIDNWELGSKSSRVEALYRFCRSLPTQKEALSL